ncbi:hypothetical protein [Methylobacterium nodulans]|uniref:Methyl-accepting chemotaxis sensory transducer n=1 Tax=Methylobacterium nodulans (strain LMG 21967 / CNCM I-2342 / ORS 2060) TaxID=460265 RepID=B8INK0_METNO|nr:hypothetical protein [Methylobacterium nodulans]ACL56526.1 methyl-accepting chemotaxis sensory transducer [Methylobacterium nodulans ORS 2060]
MRIGIRSRLYAGFGSLVLITAGLGGFSLYQQSSIVGQFEQRARYDQRARTVFDAEAQATRLAGLSEIYRSTWSAERVPQMEEARHATETISATMAGGALSEERRQIYTRMRDEAQALKGELQRLAAAGSAIASEKAKLFTGGDELTRATDRLLAEIRARGDAAQVAQGALVEAAVLLVRVANWRFLATLDPKGPATFAMNAGKAEAALKSLRGRDPEGQFTGSIKAVEGSLALLLALQSSGKEEAGRGGESGKGRRPCDPVCEGSVWRPDHRAPLSEVDIRWSVAGF